jgi:hypothetical protein
MQVFVCTGAEAFKTILLQWVMSDPVLAGNCLCSVVFGLHYSFEMLTSKCVYLFSLSQWTCHAVHKARKDLTETDFSILKGGWDCRLLVCYCSYIVSPTCTSIMTRYTLLQSWPQSTCSKLKIWNNLHLDGFNPTPEPKRKPSIMLSNGKYRSILSISWLEIIQDSDPWKMQNILSLFPS